jgi:cytochrome oxidase Cu insertion factor (SCO1/SenC/PrrC family)
MRLLLLLLPVALLVAGDHDFGPVAPVAIPEMTAHLHDGSTQSLRALLAGRRTAIQFVFVDCPTTCPLLGSLFHHVDQAIESGPQQLLTITVDPARDNAKRLAQWLVPFHPSARWRALWLAPADLARLLGTLGLRPVAPKSHTLQIFLTDAHARYVARTTELPTAQMVAHALDAPYRPAAAAPSSGATGANVYFGASPVVARVGPDPLIGAASACANCHGRAARGGAEGAVLAPALSGEQLTTAQRRRGGPATAYTQDSFCQTLRTGRDPAGVELSPVMPRYELDNRSCHRLWQFLVVR